jgi:hypothetical protein
MEWCHFAKMSTAEAGTAVVVLGDDGWEALPFGLEGEAAEISPLANRPSRSSRAWRGDVACCVGHLAEDSDR